MSNKLLISMAVWAAAIMTTACEKTPTGETKQGGSATSQADQQGTRQGTEPQKPSGQVSPTGGTGQESKGSQTAREETEQGRKPGETAPSGAEQKTEPAETAGQVAEQKGGETTRRENEQENEPGRRQAAKEREGGNAENDGLGRPTPQNPTTAESNGGAPEPSRAQLNQPQQGQAELNGQQNRPEQDQQAKESTNRSPEGGSTAGGPVNLSRDELRNLQMVLKAKGFGVGTADGILGPRTRNALIAFQRQQGLEPTGRIDQPTIVALGISNGTGSSTRGQGGAGTQ